MENEKLKYILAKQKKIQNDIKAQADTPKSKDIFIKMKYDDFGLAYGMKIDQDFDDIAFLAKRVEEYRLGERVKAILMEKDLIKVWLVENGKRD